MRRFSSDPSPLRYFSHKNAEEAIKSGQFVDIHDLGLNEFDVLITDVTDEILRTKIAELVGIQYLEKATPEEAEKTVDIGRGFLFGKNSRPIFPCVVSFEKQKRANWVFFVIDTGSPATFLSTEVSVPSMLNQFPSW